MPWLSILSHEECIYILKNEDITIIFDKFNETHHRCDDVKYTVPYLLIKIV